MIRCAIFSKFLPTNDTKIYVLTTCLLAINVLPIPGKYFSNILFITLFTKKKKKKL